MPELNGPHYASKDYRKETSSNPQPEIETELEPEVEGEPAIDFVPHHIGGGMYELSNGDRVRGKEEALKAQAEL